MCPVLSPNPTSSTAQMRFWLDGAGTASSMAAGRLWAAQGKLLRLQLCDGAWKSCSRELGCLGAQRSIPLCACAGCHRAGPTSPTLLEIHSTQSTSKCPKPPSTSSRLILLMLQSPFQKEPEVCRVVQGLKAPYRSRRRWPRAVTFRCWAQGSGEAAERAPSPVGGIVLE